MVNGALHKLVLISYSCSDRQIMSCKNASGKIQISCSMGPPAPSCLLTRPIGFSGNARVLVRLPSILLSASRQHSPYSPAHKIRPIGFSGNVLSRSLLQPEGGQCSDTELSAMGKRTQPTQTSQQNACLWLTPIPLPQPIAHDRGVDSVNFWTWDEEASRRGRPNNTCAGYNLHSESGVLRSSSIPVMH